VAKKTQDNALYIARCIYIMQVKCLYVKGGYPHKNTTFKSGLFIRPFDSNGTIFIAKSPYFVLVESNFLAKMPTARLCTNLRGYPDALRAAWDDYYGLGTRFEENPYKVSEN
jgi:hypothetical protein